MITAVIIDDEANAIESLQWELNNFKSEIQVLETFTQASEAVDFLEKNMVDAVFLDIEMPGMNGFEFLEKFEKRKFAVIITSAYHNYALPAIKAQCLDFLPKPTDEKAVKECLEKIKKFKTDHFFIDYFEEALFSKMGSKENNKKITINTDGKVMFLLPDDIIYCESDGNYSTIFLENGKKIVLSLKLKQLEEKLTDDFFRIHNSYVINLNKVQEYIKNDAYVILTNQAKIPVSRQKKSIFLDKY